MLVQVPTILLPIQLPAQSPENATEGITSVWALHTHVGDSKFQPLNFSLAQLQSLQPLVELTITLSFNLSKNKNLKI